jgi:hypothetical protein
MNINDIKNLEDVINSLTKNNPILCVKLLSSLLNQNY